jgi:hypothetical protein
MFMKRNIGFVFITSARAGFVVLALKCWWTRQPVDRLDEVLAERLRPVVERQLFPADDARHGAQPRELRLQAVVALDAAHEQARLLARDV